MKNVLFLLLFLPFAAFSQVKIKTNKLDRFTKERIIETWPSQIKAGREVGMSVNFKSVGSKFFIFLAGYGLGANTVGAEDPVIFLLENDSIVTAQSTGIQTYEIDKNQNTYNHQYQIALAGLEALSRHNLKSVRKYYYKGYADVDIAKQNQDRVKKMSQLFLDELTKSKVIYNRRVVRLEDLMKHVGDSVTVCGRVFGGRFLPNVENKPTLLNIGAPFPDQLLTVVIWEDVRHLFGEQPENFYRNKEVCITGRVELYRDRPQIVIRRKEQLEVRGGEKRRFSNRYNRR